MQNNRQKFLFIFLIMAMVSSCTEKIAEELKSVNNEASASGGVGGPNTGFRVTNKMIEGFSHFLHKENDKSSACEVVAPVGGWDADDYTKAEKTVAVDCVLEIEEYDMYRYGAELEFSVDNGLCEYVTYTPHRFFQYQPGATKRQEYEVTCDDMCSLLNESACSDLSTSNYLTYSGASALLTTLSLSGTADNAIFSDRTSGNPNTCEFDYSINGASGPNCDAGSITINKYNVESYDFGWCDGGETDLRSSRANEALCLAAGTWVPAACSDGGTDFALCVGPATWIADDCTGFTGRGELECAATGTWQLKDCQMTNPLVAITQDVSAREEESCGGDTLNCAEGPGTKIEGGKEFTGTVWTNEDLSPITEKVEIKSPYSLGYSTNRYMASYSRVCSNIDSKGPGYIGQEFKGYLVEELAQYTRYYGASVDSDNNGSDDYTVYADHGYQGALINGTRPRNSNKPYYAFNCLDKSRDVKAQIRVHIRDWDREFTNDSAFLNEVSDIDNSSEKLMDNSGIYDSDQEWNDHKDWDDFYERGFCSNPVYTIEQECTDQLGLAAWTTYDMFTTSDCRTLTEKPGDGVCTQYFNSTTTLGVAAVVATYADDKEGCLTNIPRCSLDYVPANVGPLTYTSNLQRSQCIDNGGLWIDTPYESQDASILNFINSSI